MNDPDRSNPGHTDLTWFNTTDVNTAQAAMLGVCHCAAWARQMVAGRPYADLDDVQRAAAAQWRGVGPDGWREALRAHPRIGAPLASMPSASRHEQAAVGAASRDVLTALTQGNAVYEQRFGHVFLIRASGRDPTEILDTLHSRLTNTPDVELLVAAEQHQEITALRLAALLHRDEHRR